MSKHVEHVVVLEELEEASQLFIPDSGGVVIERPRLHSGSSQVSASALLDAFFERTVSNVFPQAFIKQ